ncbi:MerR family transcriptional regulator [Thalassococcus sp. BH17M4-6]|uniref:MerR family transcriptional regulator n=1 Tax=Thalassococcus sp. BH17M4-6 TaxID=3413148 RepID=UPI003BE26243
MAKSRDAFRTISEVAEWLDTPAHVLRFWESKFSQVKPVKRAGGRRYYRPADMELLGGIKRLLHDEGMTIKGVQKILREQGVKHVSALSDRVDEEEAVADAPFIDAPEASETVVPFAPVSAAGPEQEEESAPEPAAEADPAPEPEPDPEPAPETQPEEAPLSAAPVAEDMPAMAETPAPVEEVAAEPVSEDVAPAEDAPAEEHFAQDDTQSPLPDFLRQPLSADAETPTEDETPPELTPAPEPEVAAVPGVAPVPEVADEADVAAEPEKAVEPDVAAALEPDPEPEPDEGPAPARAIPDLPDLDSITVSPGAMTALVGIKGLSADQAAEIAPVLVRLRDLQDRLTASRR